MCVVAVKYVKEYGWIGAKNRDRNYSTSIKVINSNRDGIQRLFIDDQTTRWTEGVNEYGLSILSASFSVKSDEKEGDKILGKSSQKKKKAIVSPDGLAIRTALLYKTPKEAADYLIEKKLAGATFVFNSKICYLIEGGFTIKKEDATTEKPRDYVYKLKEILKADDHCVRTNHGIDMPILGYSKKATDDHLVAARKSSEVRWEIVNNYLRDTEINDPYGFLEEMSQNPNKDKFMNPIRPGDIKKADMVTTGQLLLVPKECTLHYRPIYSEVSFDYKKLNSEAAKTFFEIISSRKLLSFKEFTAPENI